MKSIVYFILSVCVIIYIAVLSVINIFPATTIIGWGTFGTILVGIAQYGGLAIVMMYALVNFFGSPLKTVFFVLLVLVLIFFILTATIPETFQKLFGIKKGAEAAISWINF